MPTEIPHPACHRTGAKLFRLPIASGHGPADAATEDPLFQPRPVPAAPFAERFPTPAGRRALGLGVAITIELLILSLLLTLGRERLPGVKDDRPTVVTLIPPDSSQEAPEAPRPGRPRC